jgi:hypothetical protein
MSQVAIMLAVGLDSNVRATKGFDGIRGRNVPNAHSRHAALFAFAHSRPGSGAAHTLCAQNRPESAWIRRHRRGAAFALEAAP